MIPLSLLAAAPTLGEETAVIPWDPSTWGFGQWIAAVGVLGTLITLYLTFRKDQSEAVTSRTNIKVQLDKIIDDRVERQLDAAWTRIDKLEDRVATLESDLAEEREEKDRIKTIVKRFFTDLIQWDQTGRGGALPMPDEDDLKVLEIEPYDTASAAQMAALRAAQPPAGAGASAPASP